jgi:protein-S-isoprenylcysteine O-methyltransferase
MSPAPFVAAGLVVLAESLTWAGYRARLARSPFDRATATEISAAGLVGLLAALALSRWGRLPELAWAGACLTGLGAALRGWSIVTLGRSFSLTLQTHAGQRVIEHGPYRFVRHPSYLGGELALLGLGLALGSWVSAVALAAPMIWAHARRIRAEEQMMAGSFGEAWKAYCSRTWALLPFVY